MAWNRYQKRFDIFTSLPFYGVSVMLTDTRGAHEPWSQMILVHVFMKPVTFCRTFGSDQYEVSMILGALISVSYHNVNQHIGQGSLSDRCSCQLKQWQHLFHNTKILLPVLTYNSFLHFAFGHSLGTIICVVMWHTLYLWSWILFSFDHVLHFTFVILVLSKLHTFWPA